MRITFQNYLYLCSRFIQRLSLKEFPSGTGNLRHRYAGGEEPLPVDIGAV